MGKKIYAVFIFCVFFYIGLETLGDALRMAQEWNWLLFPLVWLVLILSVGMILSVLTWKGILPFFPSKSNKEGK